MTRRSIYSNRNTFDDVTRIANPRKRRQGRKLMEEEKQAAAVRRKPHNFRNRCETTQQ